MENVYSKNSDLKICKRFLIMSLLLSSNQSVDKNNDFLIRNTSWFPFWVNFSFPVQGTLILTMEKRSNVCIMHMHICIYWGMLIYQVTSVLTEFTSLHINQKSQLFKYSGAFLSGIRFTFLWLVWFLKWENHHQITSERDWSD